MAEEQSGFNRRKFLTMAAATGVGAAVGIGAGEAEAQQKSPTVETLGVTPPEHIGFFLADNPMSDKARGDFFEEAITRFWGDAEFGLHDYSNPDPRNEPIVNRETKERLGTERTLVEAAPGRAEMTLSYRSYPPFPEKESYTIYSTWAIPSRPGYSATLNFEISCKKEVKDVSGTVASPRRIEQIGVQYAIENDIDDSDRKTVVVLLYTPTSNPQNPTITFAFNRDSLKLLSDQHPNDLELTEQDDDFQFFSKQRTEPPYDREDPPLALRDLIDRIMKGAYEALVKQRG